MPTTSTAFISRRCRPLGLTSGTAYFVYLGRTVTALTPKHVEFYASTAGSGTQTAEAGFFSSPNSPNKGAQTMTKLVATGTLDSLTSAGVKRNTSAFATSVPAGTHLWAGLRTAMATAQPAISALCMDFSQGRVLSTASSGVLTGAGPWTGAIVAVPAYISIRLEIRRLGRARKHRREQNRVATPVVLRNPGLRHRRPIPR